MKKLACLALLACGLAACASNPPTWWNPGQRYNQTQPSADAAAVSTSAPARKTRPVATEEKMDPLPDNSYEEEVIAPLPEEEDTPTVQPAQEPALDNTLPTPSVLE